MTPLARGTSQCGDDVGIERHGGSHGVILRINLHAVMMLRVGG
jgi:hypothetical protein